MSCVCFDLFINTWRGGGDGVEGVEGGGGGLFKSSIVLCSQ